MILGKLPPRVCIVGGSKTGKSRLADKLGGEPGLKLYRTDDLIATHDWSAASEEASRWMDDPGPWILEGVAAVRALRKWMERNKRLGDTVVPAPCDLAIVCTRVWLPLNEGQRRMNKGHEKVWGEVEPELRRRGVSVMRFEAYDPSLYEEDPDDAITGR